MSDNTLLSLLMSGSLLGVILISVLVVMLISLALYLVQAFPLYQMAKNAHDDKAWLAFIPIANMYLVIMLAKRTGFSLLGKIFQTDKRINAFWGYLIYVLAGGIIIPIISAAVAMLPLIGALIAPLLSFAFTVIVWLFHYQVRYDLLETYRPGDSNNQFIAIISCFVPIVFLVFLWIIRNQPQRADYF